MRILTIIAAVLLCSCTGTVGKTYKIEGLVKTKDGLLKPAIWYTDTFQLDNDSTLFYYNSDSTKATIYPPYKIYKIVNQ